MKYSLKKLKNSKIVSSSIIHNTRKLDKILNDNIRSKIVWTDYSFQALESRTIILNKSYESIDVIMRCKLGLDENVVVTCKQGHTTRAFSMTYIDGKGDVVVIRSFYLNGTSLQYWSCSGYGIGNYSGYFPNINECLVPFAIYAYVLE